MKVNFTATISDENFRKFVLKKLIDLNYDNHILATKLSVTQKHLKVSAEEAALIESQTLDALKDMRDIFHDRLIKELYVDFCDLPEDLTSDLSAE